MFAYLRKPHVDLGALLLRLALAAIFITHGYIKIQQALSWTDLIPRNVQHVVGWTEFVCGIALGIGLLSRLAALGPLAIMIGAIALKPGVREFVPIDVGRQGFNFKATGDEYNVLIIAVCLTLLVLGSGRLSLDHLLFGRKKAPPSQAPATGAPHLAGSAIGQSPR